MRDLLRFQPIILAVVSTSCPSARADVLPHSGDNAEWAVLSLEGVVSLERAFQHRKSISLWGGLGTVLASGDGKRSLGGEVAAEVRSYARDDCRGASVGAYVGVALFDSHEEERHVAITPGVKVTFSMPTPAKVLLVEPYVGLSFPLTREVDGGDWDFPDVPFITLGFRLLVRCLHLCPPKRNRGGMMPCGADSTGGL